MGQGFLSNPNFRPDDTSYFFAIDIPLGEYFRIKTEVERVYWDFRAPGEWFFNFGVRFTYFENLAVEFDILYETGERLDRILRIEYRGEFKYTVLSAIIFQLITVNLSAANKFCEIKILNNRKQACFTFG